MGNADRGRLAGVHVALDARMVSSSGIGRYTRAVIRVLGDAGARLTTLSFPVPPYSPLEQIALPLKVPTCDLFFSPHITTTCLPVRARRRVVTVHDVFHLSSHSSFGPVERAYAAFLFGSAVRTADAVIAVSTFTRDELVKRFPAHAGKVHMVPNALDPEVFYPDQLRSPLEKPYVLFVGNLKPHKNLPVAVRAVELQPDPELMLVVVGCDRGFIHGMGEELEALSNNPRVLLLGLQNDASLRRLYSQAQCLLFPSLHEGFGYPPLEAMACGTPAVCSRIPALVESCGEAAVYCDPREPEDFAAAIHRVRSDSAGRRQLVAAGLERARLYSLGEFAARTLAVISGTVSRPS